MEFIIIINNTALFYATIDNNIEIVRELISRREIEVNIQNIRI